MKIDKNSLLWRAGRCLVSHFAAALLTLFLIVILTRYMVTDKGLLICGGIAIFVYAMFMYGIAWNFGQKDDNRANFGRIKRRESYGFVIGIVAVSPLFLLSLFLVLSRAGLFPNFIAPYRIFHPYFWPFINYMNRSAQVMDFSWGQILLCALVPLLIPVPIAGLGYWMGMRNISPEQKLIYKDEKK